MFGSGVILGVPFAPLPDEAAPGPGRPGRLITSLRVESAAGVVELTQDPWRVLSTPDGLTGAPFDLDLGSSPSFDGFVLRDDRPLVGPVEVLLPLMVDTTDARAAADAAAELRRVSRWSVGDVYLVATLDDSSTRRLLVRRTQSDGDSWHPLTWSHQWRVVPLRLLALDPWWQGAERSIVWAAGGGAGDFFPILPFTLSASSVLGSENPLSVGGDVDTWPEWTITGPCDSVMVTRRDGRSFGFNRPIAAGATLTVRTDPRGTGRVQHSSEGNWWRYLTPGSQLFPLRAGEDGISVAALNSEPGTSVTVSWRPRFEALL